MLFPSAEDEVQKSKEIYQSIKVVQLHGLTRELFLGLLIAWEEQYKKMTGDEHYKYYEMGLAKLKELAEKDLQDQRNKLFYDPRFYDPKRSV